MRRVLLVLVLLITISGFAASVDAVSLTAVVGGKLHGESVDFRGKVLEPDDISGVVAVGAFLVIVSDEVKNRSIAQVLQAEGMAYRVVADVDWPAGNGEIDLEAAAADGNMVYVTGSHAQTRRIKNGVPEMPERKASREQFFRFRLNANGTAGPVDGPKSLAPAIKAHSVLNGFTELASKENGIDIEGLAVKNGRLYFGFRGPVLRDEWVPIVATTWADPTTVDVLYVQLGGRGVRDIAAVDDGFLILAGPVGDGDGSYRVYFWNGKDQMSGGNGAKPQRLAEFSDLDGGKPEGLAVLNSSGKTYQILVVCDGLPKGEPTKWMLSRP